MLKSIVYETGMYIMGHDDIYLISNTNTAAPQTVDAITLIPEVIHLISNTNTAASETVDLITLILFESMKGSV
jgi:hypothetical protein